MVLGFLRWLGKNVGTLIMAFVLSMVVWASSTIADDPNQEQALDRSIPLEIEGKDPSLLIMNEIPGQVNVILNAPVSRWSDLNSDTRSLKAWVDLSGLGPGEHTVEVQVEPRGISPVRVVDKNPEVVNLSLEPLMERPISVTLTVEGEPALGYEMGELDYSPRTINLSGAESLVSRVERVRAYLNISGARQDVETSLPLLVLDGSGNPVRDLTVAPDTVDVFLPITLQGGFRTVIVNVEVVGNVANGYSLTNISVSPLTVLVFSTDPNKVNALPGYVESEPIDLTDATDDIETYLDLELPEGVEVVGDQKVLVQVTIEAIESSVSLTLPVEVIGVTPGLAADVAPETVDVILSGPVPVLNTLRPANLRAVIDLSGLEVGTHQVQPAISFLPSRIQIQSILPANLQVEITAAPTPTPTPTISLTPDLTLTPPATP